MNFDFNVRFEPVSDDRVKAFINDTLIGSVTIKSVKNRATRQSERKLTFRCSSNPFKSVVPNTYVNEHDTVVELLNDRRVLSRLIPIVLRNAIYNRPVLAPQHDDHVFLHSVHELNQYALAQAKANEAKAA